MCFKPNTTGQLWEREDREGTQQTTQHMNFPEVPAVSLQAPGPSRNHKAGWQPWQVGEHR